MRSISQSAIQASESGSGAPAARGSKRDRGEAGGSAHARVGGICGICGAVLFTVGWVLVEQIQGGVDAGADYISDLGRIGANEAWLWNTATILAGSLILVFALAVARTLNYTRRLRIGAGALVLVALCSIFDGFARLDCKLPNDRACAAREASGMVSWHHHAHLVESTIAVVALIVAPLAVGGGLRPPNVFARISRATGIALLALSIALLVAEHESYIGLVQRALALIFMGWVAVFGAWLATRLTLEPVEVAA
jgi:hypothetical protein